MLHSWSHKEILKITSKVTTYMIKTHLVLKWSDSWQCKISTLQTSSSSFQIFLQYFNCRLSKNPLSQFVKQQQTLKTWSSAPSAISITSKIWQHSILLIKYLKIHFYKLANNVKMDNEEAPDDHKKCTENITHTWWKGKKKLSLKCLKLNQMKKLINSQQVENNGIIYSTTISSCCFDWSNRLDFKRWGPGYDKKRKKQLKTTSSIWPQAKINTIL